MGQTKNVVTNNVEEMNETLTEKEALVDDFYSAENNLEEIKIDDINLDETFGILGEVEEIQPETVEKVLVEENEDESEEEGSISVEPVKEEITEDENTIPVEPIYTAQTSDVRKDGSDFDALFDSLYNDVAGANNFISNLIEQKKSVTDNAANLEEAKEKLVKEREEFDRFVQSQKESIRC